MTHAAVAWLVGGLALGLAHSHLLWSTAQAPARRVALYPIRLGLVAAVLVAAALMGNLLAAAGGWALGFALAVGTLIARRST